MATLYLAGLASAARELSLLLTPGSQYPWTILVTKCSGRPFYTRHIGLDHRHKVGPAEPQPRQCYEGLRQSYLTVRCLGRRQHRNYTKVHHHQDEQGHFDFNQGHCRKTITADGPPVEVTVDVKVITVQELQSVATSVSTTVQTVTASAVEQCFLETYTALAGGPGTSTISIPTVERSTRSTASPAASDEPIGDGDRSTDDSAQEPLGVVSDDPPVIVGSDGDMW
ncbi:hypothetical protein IL306_012196 [Fusarium sp. DS 682]|nr:hypothetical protein IL306_012196 [Fusarium sp. DS 682]